MWSGRLGQVGGWGIHLIAFLFVKIEKAVRTVQLCLFPRELGGRERCPSRAGGVEAGQRALRAGW